VSTPDGRGHSWPPSAVVKVYGVSTISNLNGFESSGFDRNRTGDLRITIFSQMPRSNQLS